MIQDLAVSTDKNLTLRRFRSILHSIHLNRFYPGCLAWAFENHQTLIRRPDPSLRQYQPHIHPSYIHHPPPKPLYLRGQPG